MILYPALEELEEQIGLRFKVVMAVAKRARMLNDGSASYFKGKETNKLSIATHEFSSGDVMCVPKGEGYFELPKSGMSEE